MRAQIRGTIYLTDTPLPDGFDPGASSWKVELRYRRRKMTLDYFTGSLAGEPSLVDVVETMLLEVSIGDSTFEDFCADYGYDQDSRRAYATWERGVEQANRFRRMLGDDAHMIIDSCLDPEVQAKRFAAEEWSER